MPRDRNGECTEGESDAVEIVPSTLAGSAMFGDCGGVAVGMDRLQASLPLVEQ
jgi:hypothetical protein